MSWIDGWDPADRAVAALSAKEPRCDRLPRDWNRFVASAARERTAAIVARHVADERLRPFAESTLARNILGLAQARELIERIGPEVIPLKGLHLVGRVYALGERDFGDLDLLVRRSRIGVADRGLRAMGFHAPVEAERALRTGGAYLNSTVYVRDESFPVHLHWHVVNASLPLFMVGIRIEEIWDESVEASVAGAPARIMAPHHVLIAACEHALKHSYDSLIRLADIDRIFASGVDLDRAVRTARRWGILPIVQWGLFFAREILRTPVEVRPPAGGLERWLTRLVRANRRGSGLGALGYFSMAAGWRGKLRFLRGALAPPVEEVEAFGKRPGWGAAGRRAWAALSSIGRIAMRRC